MEKKTPAKKAPKAPRVEWVTVTPNNPSIIHNEFNNCDLVAVKVPAKVKEISGAFMDCPNLKCVRLPASVESINSAFINCPELEEVHIGNNINSIYFGAFKNCPKLKVYIKEGGNFHEQDGVIWYLGRPNFTCAVNPVDVTLPPYAADVTTGHRTQGGKYSSGFNECKTLKSIVLNDKIQRITEETFVNCVNLESINIPNNVNFIEPGVFSGCEKLKITWGDKFVEEDGIVYKDKFKVDIMYPVNPVDVVIPNTVKSVEIIGCDSLESIVLPKSLDETYSSFIIRNCKNLKRIVVPDGLKAVKGIKNCPSFSEISIPNSVNLIRAEGLRNDRVKIIFGDCLFEQDGVFYKREDDQLTVIGFRNTVADVTLLDGVTKISEYAFCKCDFLESITIPVGVKEIGVCVFEDCKSLKTVSLPEGLYEIGYESFSGCNALEEINIPESLSKISSWGNSLTYYPIKDKNIVKRWEEIVNNS